MFPRPSDFKKVVILAGGGLDTAVLCSLFKDKEKFDVSLLHFHYSQPASFYERSAIVQLADFHGMDCLFHEIALPVPSSAFTSADGAGGFIPLRNFFLVAEACRLLLAKSFSGFIVTGNTARAVEPEGSWTMPENSFEAAGALSSCVYFGTSGKIQLLQPLTHLSDAAVLHLGVMYGAHFDLSYSCWSGKSVKHCGVCGGCLRRKYKFQEAQITDTTEYLQ